MLEPNNTAPYAAANGASSNRPKPPQRPLKVPAGHVLFRLLCHASRVGGVIGKSGAIIKQLQHDTAAKIRVEDSPRGAADERVVVVVGSSAANGRIALGEGEGCEVSSAQEAVVRVFERIVDVAAEADGVAAASGVVSCRLLAENGQAGAVIGKGGRVVEKIRKETGCRIRVLSSDKSPHGDEIIEIEGDILGVKKALVSVSSCLQDCPLDDGAKMAGSRPVGLIPQETFQDLSVDLPPQRISVPPSMPASSFTHASGGRPFLRESERAPNLELRTQPQEVGFRFLCPSDRVGAVIGKGGTIVRALQNETGASISVGAPVAECDERLITVTAMENPESRYSPAQNAVVLVFSRSMEAGAEKGLDLSSSKGSPVLARLVVPSNQVGCLLGKGGAIVSEMRKTTGAFIRIIGNEQAPKCASQNAEIVQITGEFVNVRDALYNVTSRLRDNLFSSRITNGAGTRSSSSVITEASPYGRARDPSSLGLPTSVGVSHNSNLHSLTYSMNQLGLSHHNDRPSSPSLWESQTVAGMDPRSIVDVGKGPTSIKGGIELGSGGRSAIVTNTTVEIIVPENVIGCVYGENGSNLARLRQISGAKVTVHEPHPGMTTDMMVVISGTPDETQAAQSLLQAFILTGSS
ncbi:KH domain-containing protein HEN4 [Rhododendron vialii]|uniref:KH domain-containing protein HEN4 n=1 Tax=Rhododendron vialii TaxID=182163 RepID=UPI00265D9996|nr:KH domain-containing protein HEN4 [Rhododendron vialii]